MDICLNVSSEPQFETSKGSSKKSDFFKPHVKRIAKKQKALKNQAKSPETQSELGKPQKRIKQKSLAQIVANNRSRVIPASTPDVKQNLPPQNPEKTGEKEKTTTVTFAKTAGIGLKTILAKPKPQKTSGKSLADIFAKKDDTSSDKNDGKSFKSVSDIFNRTNKIADDKKVGNSNSEVNFRQKSYNSPNFSRKNEDSDKKVGNSNFGDESQDNQSEFPEFPHKRDNKPKKFAPIPDGRPERTFGNSGKVSSLFGNNPEVPTIGQRLVKPVQEAVFSKTKFSDLEIHPFMVSNLEQNMGITNMTTVQQKAIPQILTGRDILVRSQTGSGKTLAYALPIVETLQKIRPKLMRDSGIRALVVVPTRELALQTYECFLKLIKSFTWIVPGYLVGGEKRKAEKARLRRGCTILVATPGRLLDHIKHTEALKLTNVKCFVLDEADRMLDMGYEKDISGIVSALKVTQSTTSDGSSYDPLSMLRQNKKIVFNDEENEDTDPKVEEAPIEEDAPEVKEPVREYHSGTDSEDEAQESVKAKKPLPSVPKIAGEISEAPSSPASRQTVLLSATLTNAVEKLAGLTMSDPVLIDAAEDNLRKAGGSLTEINEDLVVPERVSQTYVVTPPKLRMVTLCAYIAGRCQIPGQHKILVFMATQDMIDFFAEVFPTILTNPRDDDDDESEALVDIEFFKLHGSMSQKDRTEIFKTFRKAHSGVLLCTDVAARGLDMPKVDTVVQYTGPLSARDYVHRIGRTGRAGTSGIATIFLTPPEIEFVRALESRRIRIKQEDMKDVLEKLVGPFSKHLSVEATATDLQNKFEGLVIGDKKLHSMACKAYVSWVRFYSSYPRDMREIFNRRDLHLGHYAKSFALRDPPKKIGGIGKNLRENETSKPVHNNRLSNERPEKVRKQQPAQPSGQKPGLLKRSRILNVSEFGDGLEPIKKVKKR